MKKSLFTKPIRQCVLTLPAAALMLGAAQAGTTVGLNFQAWYYNSGTTPQTVGFGDGYQTTGFPVTGTAFGVAATNWYSCDPLDCQSVVDQYVTFGGTDTTFAGGLTAYATAPDAWQSGIGELNPEGGFSWSTDPAPGAQYVAPGNNEVTWSFLDDGNGTNQAPSVALTGLAAKFPNGYVVQTIAAENGVTAFDNVDFTDGVTTNSEPYSTYYVANLESDTICYGGTVGLSAPSGVFTNNAFQINAEIKTTGKRSVIAGFIVTDLPVVSLAPASGTYVTGQAISLTAGAIGIPPLSYQWRSNGIPIVGATSTNYALFEQPAGAFSYDVVVTNLYGAGTSAVATVTVAAPASLTWNTAAGTTGAQDGSGDWNNGFTTNWWNGSSNVVWGNLDNAVFGAGGTGAYTVTLTNYIVANSLTFNSGAYTITGGSNLTLAGSSQVTANTNATLSVVLAGASGLTKTGLGELTLTEPEAYTGNTIVNGGTLNLAYNNGGSGTLEGTLTINSNATVLTTANNALGYSGANWLRTINLNFGTLATTVTGDNGWGTTINLTGGTLAATVAGGYFAMGDGPVINVTGTNVASVISANLTVRDATSGILFNVARGTAAADLYVSGNLIEASAGGITLTGGGILELAGVSTYTGETTVSNGTLDVTGQLTGGGGVVLNDATVLDTAASDSGAAITAATLALGSSGSSTNALGFAGLNSTTVAPILVSGAVTIVNPVTVNITGPIPATGEYPLIQYSGGETASAAFKLGTLPSGVSATLVDDGSSSVYLNVTATPVQTEIWTGAASSAWDINTTANWLIGTTAAKYQEGNVVNFGDTASGKTAITLNTTVHPSIVLFTNTSQSYSLSGTGSIAGSVALTVAGAGVVTLNNTNTYAGGTTIDAGILSVATDASLGTGALTMNGGTLDLTGATAFSSSKTITLDNDATIQVDNSVGAGFALVTGGGALTKSGSGTLTFSAEQTYSGGTTINGGIVDLTGGGGASGVIRGSVTVNTNGALRCSTGDAIGYDYGDNNLESINLVGGTLDINSTANQTLGSATINMTGGAITGVIGGNLDFFGGASALNTYASAATATISGVPLSPLRQGDTTFDVQAGTTPSGIDLDISSVLRVSPNGDASGAVFYKSDAGTLRLSAVNTYQGATEVQGGTLMLTGRLIGGGALTVDDGATFLVTAGANPAVVTTNNLTLGSSGGLTLGFTNVFSPTVPVLSVGSVVINDPVTVNIGGHVPVGQFPLIHYTGTDTGSGSFVLGALPTGVSASLVNDTANQSVDLKVTTAPLSIVLDIANGTNYAYAGGTYALSVVAGGAPTLGYQWYENGTPISGATAGTLTLPLLTPANTGAYYVEVTNASGSISSSTNHLVVISVSGYAALALATQPEAFWPLNESAGPTAHDYEGGYDASYSSAGVTYDVTGPVGGTVVTVNGSSGEVACPYAAALNPSGAFTVEGWFNPASVSSSLACAIASAYTTSPREGWLIYESSAGWEFRTYNQNGTATAVDITGGTPTAGHWDHVVAEWNGTNGLLYVNGVLKNTSPATNFVANTSASFTIGVRSDAAYYWGGSVGDVAFYSRVLTPAEIRTHASGAPALSITTSAAGPVLSWVPANGGTLVASPTVNGTYTNVSAATSPWTNSAVGNQFYRVKF